jgi:TetR/AcrR family transcriptional regulator, transcriptional repressor for nem operon
MAERCEMQAEAGAMTTTTKERLLQTGMRLLLERGYSALGIQDLLSETGTPKGSFYHHFASKEAFAFAVVERYMEEVHRGLDRTLGRADRAPLDRVRDFLELSAEKYHEEGDLGCLLGALGQELAGASDRFRQRIESCLATIAGRIAGCLAEAQARGEIPRGADPHELAERLLDCWEGAALRSRLRRDPAPLAGMLDFYFGRVGAGGTGGG